MLVVVLWRSGEEGTLTLELNSGTHGGRMKRPTTRTCRDFEAHLDPRGFPIKGSADRRSEVILCSRNL